MFLAYEFCVKLYIFRTTNANETPIAGSDLLTSLTTTFDRKWRSLVSQSSSQTQSPPEASITSNKNDITEQQEQKTNTCSKFKYPSAEAYRDPSLHKSLDKNHLSRTKDVSVIRLSLIMRIIRASLMLLTSLFRFRMPLKKTPIQR
jgi:hypothetical protein